jgi:hypothetical protein
MSDEATCSVAGDADRRRPVWCRALLVGLSVGAVQVAVNQGDYWLQGNVTAAVVVKSVLSPLITVSVALLSAVWAWREG